MGLRIQHCRTFYETVTYFDVAWPHFIQKTKITKVGTDLFINLVNDVQWFILSKALDASTKQEYTGMLYLLK